MSNFWANEEKRQVAAGNPTYDWSAPLQSLTYRELEARINAALDLCDQVEQGYDWSCFVSDVRAALTGGQS